MRVLRGLMALEHGDPTAARKHLYSALKVTLSPLRIPKAIGRFGATSALEEIAYVSAEESVVERRFGFELAPLSAAYYLQLEAATRTAHGK